MIVLEEREDRRKAPSIWTDLLGNFGEIDPKGEELDHIL
jgi:hypothetical protein